MSKFLNHFMITTNDVKKSADFYSNILGFKLEYLSDNNDWAELKTEKGIELAIKKIQPGNTVGSSGLGFAVSDCKQLTEELKEKGAEIVKDCQFREEERLSHANKRSRR